MYKTGFKVVSSKADGKLYSATWNSNTAEVEYSDNFATFPRENTGSLAVFKHVEDAVKFAQRNLGIFYIVYSSIWECKYKQSDLKVIRDGRLVLAVENIPHGTDFADEVKLTRKLFDGVSLGPMTKVGFKVVLRDGDRNISISSLLPSCAEYSWDTITRPRDSDGPLGLFESLRCAVRFATQRLFDRNYKVYIYLCEYEPTSLSYFWCLGHGSMRHSFPEGTVFADSIRLRAMLYEYDGKVLKYA